MCLAVPRRSTTRQLQSELILADTQEALDGTEQACARELLDVESAQARYRQTHFEAAEQVEEAEVLRDELRAADEALQERSEAEASERAEVERLLEQTADELREVEQARAELERRVEEDDLSDSSTGHDEDVSAEHRAECAALGAERRELALELVQSEASRQELGADREGLRSDSEVAADAASDARVRAERLACELRTLEAEMLEDDDIAPQPSGRQAMSRGRLRSGARMSQAGFGTVSLPDYLNLEREAEASSRRLDQLKEDIQESARRRGEQRNLAILRIRAKEEVREPEMEARAAEEDVGSADSDSDAQAMAERCLSAQSLPKDTGDGWLAPPDGSDTSAHSFAEDRSFPANSPGQGFVNKGDACVSEPDGDIAAGDAAAGPGPSLKPFTPSSFTSTERPGALSALMDGIRVRREFQHGASSHSRADLHADVSVTRRLVDPGLGHEASTHSLPSSLHRGSSTSALAASSSGILWNLAAGPPGSGEYAGGPSARASWGGTVSSRLVGENLLLREEAEALQEDLLGAEGTEASTPCETEADAVEPFTLSASSAPLCAGPQLEAAISRSQARLRGQMQQQLEDSRALLSTLRRGISDAEQRLRRERHGREECEERLRHLECGGPSSSLPGTIARCSASPLSPPQRQPRGLLLPLGATGSSEDSDDDDDEDPEPCARPMY